MDFPYYIYTVPLYHYEVIGLHLIGLGVAAPYLTAPSRAAVYYSMEVPPSLPRFFRTSQFPYVSTY